MSFVAAVIGGVATIAAGSMAAGAANSAGNTQAAGQDLAAQTQQNMFDTINKQQQPFMNSGYGANSTLSQLLGLTDGGGNNGYLKQQFNPTQDQLNNYPGYQFALNTGEQALRNFDTPSQGALSGATMKDMVKFAEGNAATNYGNYFNQFQQQQNNIFNRLSGILGIGQNAAAQVGNNGAQLGTGVAQAQAAAAGSQAAGQIGSANAWSGALNNAGAYGMYAMQNQNKDQAQPTQQSIQDVAY